MSWAIATCDGHINCWQSKVWKPQNMELPYTEWNLIAYAPTLQCAGQRNWCIFIAVIVTCRQISVAIARIVTDKEIRVLLSQKLWRTKVAISTSVTDWLLLSLLLGRKIMYKCCYRYTVTDMSRRLRDGQLTETFYCSTYFFRNLLSPFYGFLFATLWKKGTEMLQLQPLWMHHCEIDVTIALMSITNLMLLIYLDWNYNLTPTCCS